MYLFQAVEKQEMGFANYKYSYGCDKRPQGTSHGHNCMSAWQNYFRFFNFLEGILRIFINNLVLKPFFVQSIEFLAVDLINRKFEKFVKSRFDEFFDFTVK